MRTLAWGGPGDVSLAEATVPEPASDSALVRIETSAICGSELHAEPGYNPGHEAAGTIERVPLGSTFVEGVASVGRLSQMVKTGPTSHALRGYLELIDYWERTGSWVQQWTTLRNVADLLQHHGEAEAAAFLRAAAASAPDAPPLPDTQHHESPDAEASLSQLVAQATQASRSQVLAVARDALDRRLAACT